MSNWYSKISFKICDKDSKIKKIVDWLYIGYTFNEIHINDSENSFYIEGDEAGSIYKNDEPNLLPNVVDIFTELTVNFPKCEYTASIEKKNSFCEENEEYFITCKKGLLKIESPIEAEKCDLLWFDNYDDFFEEYENIISEEKFEELKSNDVDCIYISEDGDVYTEEQYYKNYEEIFSETIDNLINKNIE